MLQQSDPVNGIGGRNENGESAEQIGERKSSEERGKVAGTETSGLLIQFGNGLREDSRNLVIRSRIIERRL